MRPLEYTDSSFQSYRDSHKPTFEFVVTLVGEVISWRSVKQSCIIDSTMEVKYVLVSKATKEVIWLRKFLMGLKVAPLVMSPLVLFCDKIRW